MSSWKVLDERDQATRKVEVPADLAAALDADSTAKQVFDSLSHSNKRGHVLVIEASKTAETRRRRIDKVITALRV